MKRTKMKCILIVVFLLSGFISQAQVYEKGDMVADAYIGWPNLYSSVVKTVFRLIPDYNVKVHSFGPVGGRFEYLFSPKIGVGLNVNYARNAISGEVNNVYDYTTDTLATFAYKASVTRLRIMPTFNLHFGKSERIDPYLQFGLGYASRTFKEETDYPNAPDLKFKKSWPVGYRVEFGTRFYIIEHLGAHVMVGIGGGPIFGIGLSGKF
jgi:hypothetical protein